MVAAGAAGVEGVGFEHDAHRGARVGELAIADATDRGDTVIGLRQVDIFIVVDFPDPFGPRKP